jgi:hypothetical protein
VAGGFPTVAFFSVSVTGVAPFPAPARRTVHAVFPHTAHRRRSPPAFGLSPQARKGLGAATVPSRLIKPT